MIPSGRSVILLIPHPDDEVVGCCAAIARARHSGATFFGAYLTTGVPSVDVLWPWQRSNHPARVARRRHEAVQAAALLGIEPLFFQDLPTRKLRFFLAPARELILQNARRVRADAIWVPAYEGGHQDHDSANSLSSTLRNDFSVWEFSEYNFFGGRVHSQQFPFPNGSEQEFLLTREEIKVKEKALALYRSERGNLRYVRSRREVLRPLPAYSYQRPPHPGKMFYQRYQWVPRHPRVDYTKPEEVCRTMQQFVAPGDAPSPRIPW